jgi:hypothetical protein
VAKMYQWLLPCISYTFPTPGYHSTYKVPLQYGRRHVLPFVSAGYLVEVSSKGGQHAKPCYSW